MTRKKDWKPRFVDWREGRPRFVPGPRERALGFRPCILRHGQDGPWFSREECRDWAESKALEIAAARAGAPVKVQAVAGDTVEHLLQAWLASPDFARRAAKTCADQRRLAAHIFWERPGLDKRGKPLAARRTLLSAAPARFIEPADVKGFFERLERDRGLAMARAIIMVLSAAFAWGRTSPVWRLKINPCHRLDLPTPEPRVFVWTEGMLASMVATADAIGRPEIGDCILMGVFTGQRLADRLELLDAGMIDLGQDGLARRFRQNKTGAVVVIPEMPQLAARLAAAKERRRALPFTVVPPNLIIDEARGVPFTTRHYNTVFNQVRAAALAGVPDPHAADGWRVPPATNLLAEARDQDLRDTAVTWLALADCTLMQVASITGHSIASIQTTIRHYLAMDPRLAGAAIGKLKGWMQREGMQL
jgi:integrase